MITRGRGKIINIASVQTALARPSIAPYTATKGGAGNLTKGMATDWAKHGLNCNAIAPGYFDTPLNAALVADPTFSTWLEKRTPAGRWGKVEELQAPASSSPRMHRASSTDISSIVDGGSRHRYELASGHHGRGRLRQVDSRRRSVRTARYPYRDGDDLHSTEAVEKMRAGIALTDDDRWPWLDRIADALESDAPLIIGCSALRRVYRDRIRAGAGGEVTFVHLAGDRDLIASRMAARSGHYMPLSLLDSQFATLERPGPDEAIEVTIDQPMKPSSARSCLISEEARNDT